MAKSINGNGPPTSKTRAQIGDFYIDQESQLVYKCTNIIPGKSLDYGFIDVHQGHDNEYEWTSIDAGLFLKVLGCEDLFYNTLSKISNTQISELIPYPEITCGATDMSSMFRNRTTLTAIPEMDTSSVTDMSWMFYDCKKLTTIPEMDTSSVTNMAYMFYNCNKLTAIPEMDTSRVTDMGDMFYGCKMLTTIPEMDTSSVTNMYRAFYTCNKLTAIPEMDTSSVINMGYMFYQCYELTVVPEKMDTSSVTTMGHMFFACNKLTAIPEMDTSSVTDMKYMCQACSELTTIPEMDTSSVTNMNNTFYNCPALTTIRGLDLNSVTATVNMLGSCSQLTNLTLYNIRTALTIGSGTSYGHLLTIDSLVHTIQELCTVTTAQVLTMGSENLAKIADLYCKITDNTNEKLTMELCESTDEGAMTLAEYAKEKNWTFK